MAPRTPFEHELVRIEILGGVRLLTAANTPVTAPNAVRRLLVLLVAAGPLRIDREQLASELWSVPPESWSSSLRNRVAAARKLIGEQSLRTEGGRLWLSADHVQIDSWDLISASAEHAADNSSRHDFSFLVGEPFDGVATTPMMESHRSALTQARIRLVAARLDDLATPLPVAARQALAVFQSKHDDPLLAQLTIEAHLMANDRASADAVNSTATPESAADLSSSSIDADSLRMFEEAIQAREWNVAADLALSGLPGAERAGGDAQRLRMLETIPIDSLPAARHFSVMNELTRHLALAGRDADAIVWSRRLWEMAVSDEDRKRAQITATMIGDPHVDLGLPPLPPNFDEPDGSTVDLQGLQLTLASQLESAGGWRAKAMVHRFQSLVEESSDPYRRWIGMYFRAMWDLHQGHIEHAYQAAERAGRYAHHFDIPDGESVAAAQMANAGWIHPQWGHADPAITTPTAGSDTNLFELGWCLVHRHQQDIDSVIAAIDLTDHSIALCSVLVTAAPDLRRATLRQSVYEWLLPQAGMSAIYPGGILTLGPVDRALSKLTSDEVVRTDHMRRAITVADRQQSALWRVVCRIELGIDCDDARYFEEAAEHATTDELAKLVESSR